MIPKRAIFFWEGGEMSWLRQKSLSSFRRLNPGWEIVVIDGKDIPIQGKSRLEVILRSDWARYRMLHMVGGVYFDTDIVFVKPIPDSWLENDMILPLGDGRVVDHIAVLGAKCGETWFKALDDACASIYRPDRVYSYQHFGVTLANLRTQALAGRKVKWLQPEMFLPIMWDKPESLWSEGGVLSPLSYGVHWFGGDWLSIAMEARAHKDWALGSTCLVAKAIKSVWAQSAEMEAHHEQLGV